MSKLTIWHNPRCSKSRQTLQIMRDAGTEPEIVLYLDTPPDVAAINAAIQQLGLPSAREMMRTGEAVYKELGLKNEGDEGELEQAMAANPKLIERPYVTDGRRAVLGRPPENVNKLL